MKSRRKSVTRDGVGTKLIHSGEFEDGDFGSVVTPIYRSTTYRLNKEVYSLVKRHAGTENPAAEITDRELKDLRYRIFYARDANPNVVVLQKKMALIEGCEDAVASSSGMGAISSTILSVIRGKSYIVSTPHLYGAAFSFVFRELKEMFGVEVLPLEQFLAGKGKGKMRGREIAAVYLESFSNPFLVIPPLEQIIDVRDRLCPEVPVIVDNTFLTPANINLFGMLDPERDVVLYSATKYLAGHSDVIAGIVCGALSRINAVWKKMVLYGCCLDGETAYYLERGLKTLHVRMERHNRNLIEVVSYLKDVSKKYGIKIFHPLNGEYDVPDFAKPLLERGRLGGMVTFNINGKGEEDGIRFMEILHKSGVIKHATSLGGVESLISMPYNMSQPSWMQQEMLGLKKYGCLLRLSVGIEDAADIIDCLDRGLRKLFRG